jgi:transcriptional regulator with XRE-family HTH domain
MLSESEIRTHLEHLGLTQVEAAQLLSVTPRTVRRWVEGSQAIPGPAEQALRAWLQLHERGLAWRPDAVSIAADDAKAIARHREHAIEIEALLERVKARGGPAAPWQVDLDRCRATLGPLQVSFYKLKNGGFAPQSYRRSGGNVDLQRDWPLIEDAFVCIADAFAKQGSPPRTRFAFAAPSMANGRLDLWDVSLQPPVVALISCQALRRALGLDKKVTDTQCRLLVSSNQELITELAEAMFAAQRHVVTEHRVRVLDITTRDIKAVASRLSLSALDGTVIWGQH